MAHCTVPRLFGIQDWFNAKFADLCDRHDFYYTIGCPFMKFYGDFWIAIQFMRRKYIGIATLSLPYNLFFGTLFWMYHRACDLKKRIYG